MERRRRDKMTHSLRKGKLVGSLNTEALLVKHHFISVSQRSQKNIL